MAKHDMTGANPLPLEELTRFGIQPADEAPHPFSPDYEWWNESVFVDWYDRDGTNAGHCRIGWHPNQDRLWMWLFLYNGEEWVAIEETRLPLARLKLPKIAYDDGWGLRFSYRTIEPLRAAHLEASGFGRVVTGRRTGMILPVEVALDVSTVGPAHSLGESSVPGHSDETLSTNRFEQPVRVAGSYGIAGDVRAIEGRGERDHSWGPRLWNMQWRFMVVNGDDFRLQCTCVDIPGIDEIRTGYLHHARMTTLTEVAFDLVFDDDTVTNPLHGRFSVKADDGTALAGSIEALTATEIDITHVFEPPRRPVYRRALVRCTPDGGRPALGWLEFNRFVD
jgi:hypothetical protein